MANQLSANFTMRKMTFRGARRRRNSGVTLVEVMISMTILATFTAGLIAVLLLAYRLAATVRIRDQARFVLASAGDQFLRGPYYQGNGSTVQTFFTPSATPTGTGMAWQNVLQVFAFPPSVSDPNYTLGTAAGLTIVIDQGSGHTTNATLTRQVATIDPATGNSAVVSATPAGLLLQGIFTVSYIYNGKQFSQTTTVLRSAP